MASCSHANTHRSPAVGGGVAVCEGVEVAPHAVLGEAAIARNNGLNYDCVCVPSLVGQCDAIVLAQLG
jgi:hypothetical protein